VQSKNWELEDAQKIADEFPYTSHKPSGDVVSKLQNGNLAKCIFRFQSDDPEAPRAERMWILISDISDGVFTGRLDNDPQYIDSLKYQDLVTFSECHIIDTDLDDPIPSVTDKYIKRCFVTNNILHDGAPVGYLYREEPDNDDDSGWRFTTGTETDEYMDNAANTSIVSLGAVLRQDDSCVALLDRNYDVAFIKDENDEFVELHD
jgi:hypothetical protein